MRPELSAVYMETHLEREGRRKEARGEIEQGTFTPPSLRMLLASEVKVLYRRNSHL